MAVDIGALPLSEVCQPFIPLAEHNLGGMPAWSGCSGTSDGIRHGDVVFRALPHPPSLVVPTPEPRSLSPAGFYALRDALRTAAPGVKVKVVWHVAECRWCGARAVRPGALARLELEGGAILEREYSIAPAR